MCERKNPQTPRSGKEKGEKVHQTPEQRVSPEGCGEGHSEAAVPLKPMKIHGAAEMDLRRAQGQGSWLHPKKAVTP